MRSFTYRRPPYEHTINLDMVDKYTVHDDGRVAFRLIGDRDYNRGEAAFEGDEARELLAALKSTHPRLCHVRDGMHCHFCRAPLYPYSEFKLEEECWKRIELFGLKTAASTNPTPEPATPAETSTLTATSTQTKENV